MFGKRFYIKNIEILTFFQGDSGGPLVASTAEGDLYQVGVVSYGLIICGIFDVPDVYTRVSEFDQWLQIIMDAA